MPNGWRTIKSFVHKIRLHDRRGKRNGWILLARKIKARTAEWRRMKNPVWPRPVRLTNLMSRMNGKKTHTTDPKTITAESIVGRIWLANTHFLPFLAKSDRVLPVIATLLSFNPLLAIFCSVFGHFMSLSGGLLDYSNRPTWATRAISKISPRWRGDWQNFLIFLWTILGVTSYIPVCLGDTLEALLHQPDPQQEPTLKCRQGDA